jgi:hypothetical protein
MFSRVVHTIYSTKWLWAAQKLPVNMKIPVKTQIIAYICHTQNESHSGYMNVPAVHSQCGQCGSDGNMYTTGRKHQHLRSVSIG